MAFVLLIHSETLGVKINNPTCFLKCSDWNTLNCYILYINYPILAGYFPNRVVPRMSSHCYKKYAAFLPRKWLKTAYFCIGNVILLSQNRWGGCYVIATKQLQSSCFIFSILLQFFHQLPKIATNIIY